MMYWILSLLSLLSDQGDDEMVVQLVPMIHNGG